MRRSAWIAGAMLCVMLAAAPPAGAARLQVRFADGRTAAPLDVERRESGSDEQYLVADALCEALGLDRFWKPETRKLVIKAADRTLQVTVDTRLVLDGSTEILLHVPVRETQEGVVVPLEFVERVLAPALGNGLQLDRAQLVLNVGPGQTDVLRVEYRSGASGTEVRVQLVRPLQYRAEATSDQLVRLVLYDARIDALALAADQPATLVKSARAEQRGKDAVLYFEMVPPIGGISDRAEADGSTILLAVLRGAAPIEPTQPADLRPLVEMHAAPDSFDLVALDAGHGGFDKGVQAGGKLEKDVTLQLATALQPMLEQALGLRVLLLRANDQTLSAETRAEVANRSGADLLVSLHCNGAFGSAARGIEVLYPEATPSTAGDAALAATQHGMAEFNAAETVFLPYADQSAVWAEMVRDAIADALGGTNRGVHAAPIDLLRLVAMPAVQVECGFLTHPQEAARFGTPEFADRLGKALAASIDKYRSRYVNGAAKDRRKP